MKAAVIGFGYWGVNIARNFLGNSNFEEVHIVDMNPARAKKAKTMFTEAHVTSDLSSVFNDDGIDAVAIVTPVNTHFELAKMALQKGKHVLVEKPMTSQLAQAQELVRLAKEQNKVLMVDHTFIHTPVVRKMKELLDSGALGQPWYFDSVRINLGLFQHDVNVVWDLAVHDLAILSYLVSDRPIEISAHGVAHTASGLADIAYLNLKYASGFIAHIHVNWLAPTKIRQVILAGSEKMAVWDDLNQAEKLRIYDKGINLQNSSEDTKQKTLVQYRIGDMCAPALAQTEALSSLVESFASAIKGQNITECTGIQGMEVVSILEAAEESLQKGGVFVKIKGDSNIPLGPVSPLRQNFIDNPQPLS